MQTFWQDLRYGARMLKTRLGFTIIAVVTLALGISANTAIFSVVNAVLLRPLPFEQPDRLLRVWASRPRRGEDQIVVSPGDFTEWREQNQSCSHMAAVDYVTYNLTGGSVPEQLQSLRAS